MGIFNGIEEVKGRLKAPVLTIGNFDGVHKGHRALFEIVKGKARDRSSHSAVLTFDPHPLKVLAPEKAPEPLVSKEEKIELILSIGIDHVICQMFDSDFAKISARDFVEKILVDTLKISELVVGYDYAFGRNREGNIDLLKEIGAKRGFGVYVLQPVNINGRVASSTAIRNLIKDGEIDLANQLLGRYYSVKGRVIRGKGRGQSVLNIPTANLEISDRLIPKRGVYATRTTIKEQTYPSITNIGYNPTFGNDKLNIETHILDYYSDLLNQEIKVEFVKRIRDEVKFENIVKLKEQILKDISEARNILKESLNSFRPVNSLLSV